MRRYQVDLEHLRHECRKRFSNVQPGLCTHCRKYIHLDLGRHVASFHLDLAQLWRCPGALYGGARHRIVLTICRERWSTVLRSSVSGVATDTLLYSQIGLPLVHRYHVCVVWVPMSPSVVHIWLDFRPFSMLPMLPVSAVP